MRSGVLTSVHAFASDPRRGVFILVILAAFIAGPLALFAWRAPLLRQGGLFAPISREGALVLNNLLLTTVCAVVFFGTLYPLALEQLTGEKITVGAPFFNLTAGVLLMAIAFATPFGFSLAWKRGDLLGVAQRLAVAFAGGLVVLVALVAFLRGGPVAGADRGGAGGRSSCSARSARSSRASGGAARRSASWRSRAPACRCRSGAARSPISAPASRCSASPRPASAPRRSR